MRTLAASDFAGRVNFFTGPGRASGKTSLLLAALAMMRRGGERPALLGIGFEGAAKGLGAAQGRTTKLRVETGELFASTATWLEGCGAAPEILGLLSGSGAFGKLALARAGRPGEVVLVGPESNEATAEAIALMREEGATSVLVDGAFGRLTQVASIEGARFFSSMIVDRGNLATTMASMRRLTALAALPLYEDVAEAGRAKNDGAAETKVAAAMLGSGAAREGMSGTEAGILIIDGPLTAAIAAKLPERPILIVVDDFTKLFLEDAALRILLSRHLLAVRRRIEFGGFVVARRGVAMGELEELALSFGGEQLLFASPYEEGEAHAA